MKLFAISDLHLSFGTDKPMNVFKGWDNYTERLKSNWNRLVSEEDTVIISGDISWAINLLEATPDFDFLNSLKGKKIILKGNHDFWWSTVSKIKEMFLNNNFDTIDILHNNYFTDGSISLCGTRGWLYDSSAEKDEKIIKRECLRLEKSLLDGTKNGQKPIVFLHYPPVYGEFVCEEIVSVLKKYNVTDVYYGHIHGLGNNKAVDEYDGIKMHLISCDCVDFTPVFVCQYMKNA